MNTLPKGKMWSCDFETTTDITDCRVWAWAAVDINYGTFIYGNTIESFITWLSKSSKTIYFHNLKFDFSFIVDYLLKNGWIHNEPVKSMDSNGKERMCPPKLEPFHFETLINAQGIFYTAKLKFKRANIKILDSLKVLPYSVDYIAKGFGMEINKLSIDYKAFREVGHELTPQEIAYIKHDVLIVAKALRILFDEGFAKITAGSNAFTFFQEGMGGKNEFRRMFPLLDEGVDTFCRKAYKGGFTYVNPKFQDIVVGCGRVYDVNSLYPYSMHSGDGHLYPYGKPQYFTGEYKENRSYPLFIQRLFCSFTIKEGFVPCIQLKNTRGFIPTEYICDSKGIVELTLTSIDYEIFKNHYEIDNISFIDGYMFHGIEGVFDGYIDKWYAEKAKAKENGNKAMYLLSKLMQNSLYGKFGTNPLVQNRYPYLKENVVHYKAGEKYTKDSVYIPVACFVTAYARRTTITAIQANYQRFIYADTDSIHIAGDADPVNIPVHSFTLGAWKHESTFSSGRFVRAKLYYEITGKKWRCKKWRYGKYVKPFKRLNRKRSLVVDIKGAGMTNHVKNNVLKDSLAQFTHGTEYSGKLVAKVVSGGTVLVDTTFSIR